MNKIRDKIASEQATGCCEHGELIFQTKNGGITDEDAAGRLYNGEEVAVPSAGSGSYNDVFQAMGFTEVKVIDWGNSAGDWTFGVKNESGWRVAWQENRYPCYGFRYFINLNDYGYGMFEDLIDEKN